jgi:chromosome segregation ATPase
MILIVLTKNLIVTGAVLMLSLLSYSMVPGEFEKLENIISQTARIREEISRETQKWNLERQLLQEEKKLLIKETEFLDKEINNMEIQNVSASSKYAEMVHKKENNEKFIQSLNNSLSKSEEEVKNLISMLPESLKQDMRVYVHKIENSSNLSNSQRLQTILSFYSHIEKLNNTFHTGMEVLGDENKREYKVLYVGLAIGYAVSANNDSAGILLYKDNQWNFERNDNIKNAVKSAIEIINKERAAEWLKLPFFKVR